MPRFDASERLPRVGHDRNMTREEVARLVVRAQGGCKESRDRIVTQFVPVIINTVTRNYSKFALVERTIDVDDILQIGFMSIYKAIDAYRPGGYPFPYLVVHHAHWCIRYELQQILGPIQVPAGTFGIWRKWVKAREQLTKELGRVPSRTEIMEWFGLSKANADLAETVDRRRSKPRTIPARLRGNRRPTTWDYEAIEPRNDQKAADLRIDVAEQVGKLPDREAEIVRQRHGLGGSHPRPLREVALASGVHITTVWLHEQRGLEKLAVALA